MSLQAIPMFFCIECAARHAGEDFDAFDPRLEEIDAALTRFEAGQLYMLDGDPDHMKAAPCDCCHNAGEIGDRYAFAFEPATTTGA